MPDVTTIQPPQPTLLEELLASAAVNPTAPESAPAPDAPPAVGPDGAPVPSWAQMPQWQPPAPQQAQPPMQPTWQPPPQNIPPTGYNGQPMYPQGGYNQPPQAPADPTVAFGLTSTEAETYGDALPVIQKVITAMTTPLRAQLEEARAVAAQAAGSSETAFVGQVRSAVPAMDSAVNDPRWAGFLNSRVPNMPFTYQDVLAAGHNARDIQSVQNVFNTFTQATTRPSVPYGGNSVPANVPAATAPQTMMPTPPAPQTTTAQTLKWSTYNSASTEYRAGRLSREDFLKIKAIYDPAIAENRVKYDA